MLSLSQIYPIICFSVGWPLNFLLIWLIIYKTNKNMRIWSWLLLQTALYDLANLLIFFIVQPITFFHGTAVGFYSGGPFGGKGSPVEIIFLLLCCLIYFYELSKYAIAGQFFYRWMIICRERSPSTSIYAVAIGLPAMCAFFKAFVCTFITSDFTVPQPTSSPAECPQCPGDRTFFYYKSADSNEYVINIKFYMACNWTTYAIILVTALLIWCKTHKSIMPDQRNSREFSRQIGLVLFVQALIPFVLSLLPSLLIAFFTGAGIPLFCLQPWHSMLAPVPTFLIVGQYRQFFFKLLCNKNATTTKMIISTNAVELVKPNESNKRTTN